MPEQGASVSPPKQQLLWQNLSAVNYFRMLESAEAYNFQGKAQTIDCISCGSCWSVSDLTSAIAAHPPHPTLWQEAVQGLLEHLAHSLQEPSGQKALSTKY